MKKLLLIFTLLLLSTSVFVSCSKQDDAGIQIDGNGRPRSAAQPAGNVTPAGKGTCTDPKVEAEYGIAIDPDGRP